MVRLMVPSDPGDTPEAQIEQRLGLYRLLKGSAEPFDAALQREVTRRELDRARNFSAANNHAVAVARSTPRDRRPLLRSVEVPTLVVHDTEDFILPYAHGVSLAETIPGAALLTLERAGHDLPQVYMSELVARIAPQEGD